MIEQPGYVGNDIWFEMLFVAAVIWCFGVFCGVMACH